MNEQSITGTYKLTALTYRQNSSAASQDLYSSLDACQKDNVFIFNADHTFYYQDIGVLCSPPSNDASTWSLNGSSLEFSGDVNNVTSFDCNNMVTTVSNYNFPGDLLTATYRKQ